LRYRRGVCAFAYDSRRLFPDPVDEFHEQIDRDEAWEGYQHRTSARGSPVLIVRAHLLLSLSEPPSRPRRNRWWLGQPRGPHSPSAGRCAPQMAAGADSVAVECSYSGRARATTGEPRSGGRRPTPVSVLPRLIGRLLPYRTLQSLLVASWDRAIPQCANLQSTRGL
jgi:hypothetical protein